MRLLSVITAVALAASSRPAVAEPRQIRIATLAPSGSPWMVLLERAAAEIAKETEGRVTIKYYTGEDRPRAPRRLCRGPARAR